MTPSARPRQQRAKPTSSRLLAAVAITTTTSSSSSSSSSYVVLTTRFTALVALLLLLASTPCVSARPQFPGMLHGGAGPGGLGWGNLSTIVSPVDGTITVRYTDPRAACRTAFDSQQQYAGWVNVPAGTDGGLFSYDTNLFFWFVAARQPTNLLTIWLNGGPGASSMFGFFTETGPCEVVERGLGKFDTVAREWGWDRASNMLFIDQPNQVGFSYDVLTNGSLDLLTGAVYTPPQPVPSSRSPITFLNGTFSSNSANATANTTDVAAMAVWHMLQGFLSAFPQYNPPGNGTLGVNLFAESYGGKYGPAFAERWEQQNWKRRYGTIPAASTLDISLTSLGIVNGCVDDLVQGPLYPAYASAGGNPYGLSAINSVRATLANASFYAPGGCQDLVGQCRAALAASDPDNRGNVKSVNDACYQAYVSCLNNVVLPYSDAGRSVYDLAHPVPDSFPPSTYLEYVNTAAFQAALGGALPNYTETSGTVNTAFVLTGDYERGAMVPKLAGLLNDGVRVGLMYGDRDYICNWLGGEAVSLAVAAAAGGRYAGRFPAAGYAPIIVNDSYIGGVVRQFGNLSFARIYQAGHSAPAYQPETAFQIFARIIMGTSVSTGEGISLASYNTSGPANATQTFPMPAAPRQTCWVRNAALGCTDDQKSVLAAGGKAGGVVINGVLYSSSADWPLYAAQTTSGALPTSSGPGGTPTSGGAGKGSPTSTQVLTGLFTATTTPNSGAGSLVAGDGPSATRVSLLAAAVAVVLFGGSGLAF